MLTTIRPDEMKRVERRMMEGTGTPSLILMERAATHVANAVAPFLREGGRLWALCGTGNNGGDGLAAVRILLARMPGLRVTVWQLPGTPSPETVEQQKRLMVYAARVTTEIVAHGLPPVPVQVACVIDALFGTGLNRPLEGIAQLAVEAVNGAGYPVVAVDIPSGISGDTGYPPQGMRSATMVQATVTVTFHRVKPGLLLGDGLDACGRVLVGDIGIPPEWDDAPGMNVLTNGDRLLPSRKRNTHKGAYGRMLAVVGSFGMAGAAGICATAALRAGVGTVSIACPADVVPTVQTLCPCAVCIPLPQGDVATAWEGLLPALTKADSVVIGCGLGKGPFARALVERLIGWLQVHATPAVLDADALNWLAQLVNDGGNGSAMESDNDGKVQPATRDAAVQSQVDLCAIRLPLPETIVLTPHVGEAARLLGWTTSRVALDQAEAARAIKTRYGASVVLKSASSVLIGADGEAINAYGTAAMAKGGSGDALAGVLGAMLAGQQVYTLHGVRLLQVACALHGLAGLLAVESRGERGMLATDLCDVLGRVPDVAERGISIPLKAPEKRAVTYDASTVSLQQHTEEVDVATTRDVPEANQPQHTKHLSAICSALGRQVRVTIDRPVGYHHTEHRDVVYALNHGFVANVLAADNEWQDAYVIGVNEPLETFEGEVIAVIHRLKDVQDQWIVAAPGTRITASEIRARTAFVERFYQSEILML